MRAVGKVLFGFGLATAPTSLLVCLDAALRSVCFGFPLTWYLVTGLGGALLAGWWWRRRSAAALRLGWRAGLLAATALAGVLGAMEMRRPPSWHSQCAWRYCSRVLGPGLDRSPFPVGAPSCSGLRMCANEAPLAEDQRSRLHGVMLERGCASP